MGDPSVMAHWNYLLTKFEALDTDESDDLLGEIVNKWIKIRGHSFASGWVEQYQVATKQSTKKKGLQKSLQQVHTVTLVHRVKELYAKCHVN